MSTEGEWTCLEKLLLAQSVYKLGENSWAEVASNLNHSSLLDRQPDFFQQEECFEQYSRLLDSIGKSEKPSVSATNHTDEPAVVVQIARELHIQRLEELRREIEETNEKYTTLTNEIHAIRDGKWDERLIAEEASKDQPKTTVSAHTELTIDDNDAIKMEPSEIVGTEGAETTQHEQKSVPPQLPQNEKTTIPTSPGVSTTPLSLLDNGSAVNTPVEQGPVTPAEAMATPPPLPPSQPSLPAAPTEINMPLGNDVATIMNRIENTTQGSAPAVETRQPETAIVQSIVEEPTPKDVLEAASEPHVTARPTVSAPEPEDRQESEESFHSAVTQMEHEIDSVGLQHEQHLAEQLPHSHALPLPVGQQPLVQKEPLADASFSMNSVSAEEPLDSENSSWDNGTKRKSEDDAETITGEAEGTEVKRQRTGNGVTQEITAESVLPNKEASQENAEMKPNEAAPISNTYLLPSTTASTDAIHQSADEEPRSPDAVYPRSPEAPLSMTSGADAESITGSESNAPTPTGSAPSSENKRAGGGSSSSGRSKDEQRQQKSWQKNINLLWREISNHKNGAMFMNPIKEATAPSYYDIVKHPMDLKAIKNRIRDGFIKSTVEFERDIVLMLTNSLMYNKEGTEMYQMAVEMLEDVTEQVKLFKTADSNSPPVSHTRKASTIAKDRRKSISDF